MSEANKKEVIRLSIRYKSFDEDLPFAKTQEQTLELKICKKKNMMIRYSRSHAFNKVEESNQLQNVDMLRSRPRVRLGRFPGPRDGGIRDSLARFLADTARCEAYI